MESGASLNWRALAQTAVTPISDTFTGPASKTTASPTPVPVQTVTPSPTLIGTGSKTITVNVGGNSGVYRTTVMGRGITGLIVTGTVVSGPGKNTPPAPVTVYQYIDLEPAQ